VSISGPDLLVPPGPAVTLSLIFHELATNAAKYGSLSVPAGSLEITWSIDEDEVHLRWAERNGPAPSRPARSGFGTQLIETSVTRELEGRWSVEFGALGLTCEVEVPTALLTGNAGRASSAGS
ncbi:MAG TPA: sensor histidine kinase, partial [Propylenella sp.]|nr:sensor histidine kinase [Propylenella sp.]